MYSTETLNSVVVSHGFQEDRAAVHSGLSAVRYGRTVTIDSSARGRLVQFVECVLSSAPEWSLDDGAELCLIAGEVAELVSLDEHAPEGHRRWLRLRSALLYELGGAPSMAATVLRDGDAPPLVMDFFRREGPFGVLGSTLPDQAGPAISQLPIEWSAVAWDAERTAQYLQVQRDAFGDSGGLALARVARSLSLPLLATDYEALGAAIMKRLGTATRTVLDNVLLETLNTLSFPCELWRAQSDAILGGLLNTEIRSWGMAAPTGTGKSFVTRVLIADTLLKFPGALILYVVPSKALVYEVSTRLSESLSLLDYRVTAVTPALVQLDVQEEEAIASSAVLVLTPEKADLLVRLSSNSFERTRVVIVDEAHHIESGTRGILLEMYLWRLRSLIPSNARFVFLSAVVPNIRQLTEWIGDPSHAVSHRSRATRMRVGVYRIRGSGKARAGWIEYENGVSLSLFDRDVEAGRRAQIAQLTHALGVAGPVLVVAKGKRECENLAIEMAKRLNQNEEMPTEEFANDVVQRLDSRLERELYPEVLMRDLVKARVVYHHAGLPPRVRIAVEEAIRLGHIRYVFATTTLAEGVNFPFASVVVQALALRDPPAKGQPARYSPLTPRVFWNIAGRAGRPGVDREGQVILFEPSLGLDKIEYVIGDYLNPDLTTIAPVSSAFAKGLEALVDGISSGELSERWIAEPAIDERTPKHIQGTVNLVRISLLHARAKGIMSSPEDILEGTFAAQFLDPETRSVAESLIDAQDRVVRDFFDRPNAPSVEVAAELGLSIQTLSDLRTYAQSRQDWQLRNMSMLIRGGEIDGNQIDYVVAPVAARMGELEGGRLGGFFTELVRQWILGVPFSQITRTRRQAIEDLVAVIYSRIQFLLPWGLYAFDRLVEEECERREITYNNSIRSVATLVDVGVPGFDELRLTYANFERVDAVRLARGYRRGGGLERGVDIVGWLSSLSDAEVVRIVMGEDRRRVDFDLDVCCGVSSRDERADGAATGKLLETLGPVSC